MKFEVLFDSDQVSDYVVKKGGESLYSVLGRIENLGTREQHVKYLRNGIWGIKKGEHRIILFQDGNKLILVEAFRKKSQKIPDKKINKAIKVKNTYK